MSRYLKADFNSPLLIGEKNPQENGERIREKLNQVPEARLLLERVAMIDPEKMSLEVAEGRSLAKYTTKELNVMPEEEYERSTRFTIQASPS